MEIVDSIRIEESAANVLAFVTDYDNDVRWREGVLEMRARGPVTAGTATYEKLTFLGSTYVTEGVVTEKTDRRLAFHGESDSVEARGYREVVADGDGAVVTYALDLRPKGALKLVFPLLRRLYAARVRRDLQRLKATLEP